MRFIIFSLTALSIGVSDAKQGHSITVATGGKNSTYHHMFKNMGEICVNTTPLLERQTSGSIENITLLLNNEVDLAMVQVDVLKAKLKKFSDKRAQDIKALIPLHSEEVHLLVKENEQINPLAQKGSKIASWGGSYVTARIINANVKKYNFFVIKYENRASALNDLQKGKINAVIAVVGQPATWVKNLKGYKLLPIPYHKGLQEIYTKAVIRDYKEYFLKGIETIAVSSVLVNRDFKSAERKDPLLKYRKCIIDKSLRLKEGKGMHSKWGHIDFDIYPWPKYQ